jgi:MoaA/NifB/PqqE/SkfB family radical SAM enzyme
VEIVIVTNGSHKKVSWWNELGLCLGPQDSVHFSIDGYDNASNNLYRVNSDYDSIVAGLQALRAASLCQIVWATIAFKFNEDHMERMQQFAKDLGVDRFQLTKSTKFGSVYPSYGVDDPLEPSVKFVSGTHRFEREVVALSDAGEWQEIPLTNLKLFNQTKSRNDITPLCEIGNKGLYIDARGRLFPCCWVANRYNHNSDWQQIANNFNLNTRTLADSITDPFWAAEFQSFKWQECQSKCKSSVVDEKYATTW